MPRDRGAAGDRDGRSAARTAADAAEFERLVARHAADISRLAYLLTGDSHEADDLAGDVLLAAWRQWDEVKSARSPVAYLRRVTANLAASRIRRRTRWRALLPTLASDARSPGRAPDGTGVDVRNALAQLPPGRRACVVLRLAFDLPEQEVADILQVSVGTVKSQTSKAVRTLRGLLEETAEPVDRGLRATGGTPDHPTLAGRPGRGTRAAK